MSGYQTTDFINSCEVLKLYRIYYNPYRQKQHVATIFRKQDGGETLSYFDTLLVKQSNPLWLPFFIAYSQQGLKFTELAWWAMNDIQFRLEDVLDTLED